METKNCKYKNVSFHSLLLSDHSHIPQGRGSNPSPIFYYKKVSSILKPSKSFPKELHPNQTDLYQTFSKINKFKLRVFSCKFLEWGFPACRNCKNKLIKKPIKLSCLSPYCNELECIQNRIRCIVFRLKEFGIRSKNLYTFSMGFKPVAVITKEDRIFKQKVFQFFMKNLNDYYEEVEKERIKEIRKTNLNTKDKPKKLISICARDLNKSQYGGGLRLHYHIATLPKDWKHLQIMIEEVEAITKDKFNVEFAHSWAGYKKTSSTLSYFAKRIAGVFGHNRNDEQAFTYKDIMPIEDYYKTFYKTKGLNFFNIKYRSREARTELISMLNVIPKICPNCNIPTRNNIIFISLDDDKPPDLTISKINAESEAVAIDFVKIK